MSHPTINPSPEGTPTQIYVRFNGETGDGKSVNAAIGCDGEERASVQELTMMTSLAYGIGLLFGAIPDGTEDGSINKNAADAAKRVADYLMGILIMRTSEKNAGKEAPTHEEAEEAWRQIRNDPLEHYWEGAKIGFEYAVRESGVVLGGAGGVFFKTEAAARRYIKRLEAADDAFDRAYPRRKVVVRVVTPWVALEG